ncbi:MAG TPA: ABC transporter permease [Verrucomicrobiae bacterium]|jgi:putative ABC transport system permease protein|nr:ABC transporter permease [Verrucomicrobiae bacterium]
MRMILDIFGQVMRTLWAHKLRSFLTMFGIAWGVGSLLLLIGLGEGFRSGQMKNMANIGQDVIFIWGGRIPNVSGQHQGMKPYFLTYKDFLDIRKEAALVREVAPIINRGDLRAVSEWASSSSTVTGSTPNFATIRYLPLGQGRWLNDKDETDRRAVCVLGFQMMRNLFPGRPAIGSFILINGVRFEVVGVLGNIGRQENNMNNVRLYMPFSTMKMFFPMKTEQTTDDISVINLQPVSRDQHAEALDQVHKIVARNHGFDVSNKEAFEGWDTVQSAETVGRIFTAMDVFLGGVGMVTLALGAIGIINIMLVSVTERTREIGLMKALGATNRSILMQFFLEGAFLTALSGGLGIGAVQGLMKLMTLVELPPFFDPPHLVPKSAALAVLSLCVAGIVAGLYPARKASLLTPVEALRKE